MVFLNTQFAASDSSQAPKGPRGFDFKWFSPESSQVFINSSCELWHSKCENLFDKSFVFIWLLVRRIKDERRTSVNTLFFSPLRATRFGVSVLSKNTVCVQHHQIAFKMIPFLMKFSNSVRVHYGQAAIPAVIKLARTERREKLIARRTWTRKKTCNYELRQGKIVFAKFAHCWFFMNLYLKLMQNL